MGQAEFTSLTCSKSGQAEVQVLLAPGAGPGVWLPWDLGGAWEKVDSPSNPDEPGDARTHPSHHEASVSENEASAREAGPRGREGCWSRLSSWVLSGYNQFLF